MDITYLRSASPLADHPLRAALMAFPAAGFTLALGTDAAYASTVNLTWSNFSAWLLFAGLVGGGLAWLAALVDLLRWRRGEGRAWAHLGALAITLALALVNSLIHARDGWTAVVPTGLALSAVTVVALIVTVWLGRLPALSPYDRPLIPGARRRA